MEQHIVKLTSYLLEHHTQLDTASLTLLYERDQVVYDLVTKIASE